LDDAINQERILLLMAENDFSRLIRETVRGQLGFECDIADGDKRRRPTPEELKAKYLATVLDFDARDRKNEEILNELLSGTVPLIICTENLTDQVRDVILTKNVIDYLVKGEKSIAVVDQLIAILRRVHKNRNVKILIVDDSSVSRAVVKDALTAQRFVVSEAARSEEVMGILNDSQDIRLCIIDYNMPVINGLELTNLIRTKYSKEDIAIIGISAYGSNIIPSQFLKMGANDFILKPFSNAEFCFRVLQNLEMLEFIDLVRKSAVTDFLTGLHNRRYVFEVGEKIFENVKRENFDMTIAMIDIDNFKQINDSRGHAVGDEVLIHLARGLKTNFRNADLISRFGGDEFCIIAINLDRGNANWKFEKLREDVEKARLVHKKQSANYTISIGIATRPSDSLDYSIRKADKLLYQAKAAGKNRICIDD
jgi:diguanylate cyclase (GGDEF)-like protein